MLVMWEALIAEFLAGKQLVDMKEGYCLTVNL
jgi:hypothetical protein